MIEWRELFLGAHMLLIERNAIATADPVDFAAFADHLRLEATEAASALIYASTAAREIEDYCGLALLAQEIVAVSDPWPGQVLRLPVGPANPSSVPAVELIEGDGSLTPITEGWTFNGGRFPTITFTGTPGGRLRVTYEAGFGADAESLPRDLHHAIMDQALRLYDRRGDTDAPATLAPSAARIAARYRRVVVAA